MKRLLFGLFLTGLTVLFLSCSSAAEETGKKSCTYTVEHYKESTGGGFSEAAGESESLQGEEAADVQYTPKVYAGFTYDSRLTTIDGTARTSGSIAADGSTVVRLYYTRNIITLTFNPAGGVFPQDFSDGVLTGRYGEAVSVVPPEKEGSVFSDWNPSLPETFPAEDSVYTAIWDSQKYLINYSVDAGGTNEGNPATYTVETDTIVLAAPVRDGYVFDGWYDSADFTGSRILQIEKGSTGNITLYAKWKADTYTLTFHPNGSRGAKYTQEFTFGTTQPLTAVAYERKGYSFTGWNTDSKGTGTAYADTAEYTTGMADADLYAQWEVITYDIIYVLNGGTNASDNPLNFTIASESIDLKEPDKNGCTFAGWYTNSDCSGSKKRKIVKGSAENITLYAKWSE